MEIIKPTIVKVEHLELELQFYISSDGKTAGMSQSALARLCGVSERGMFSEGGIISKLSQKNDRYWNVPDCLEPFAGKVFSTDIKGDASNIKLANIINSDAAAAIIEYYAYESKAANETAKRSFRAFARVGIETWIRSITGFNEENNIDKNFGELKSMMSILIDKVDHVETELKDFKRVVTVYPCLDKFKNDLKLLAPFGEVFSVRQFLEAKDITIIDSLYRKIRLQVAQTYESLTGGPPKKRQTFNTETGKRCGYEYVYRVEDVPMIEEVAKKVLFK